MKKQIITAIFTVLAMSFTAAQKKKDAQVSKLYQNYIAIKAALASDDAGKAAKSASEFVRTASTVKNNTIPAKNLATLKNEAAGIAKTGNISAQREIFHHLSDDMYTLSRQFSFSEKPVYLQYCPMAEAGWLSNEEKIVNPYYGSSMLTCGTVKSTIK
ncbi:DUF3347 domain-containing protein [Chryseobacterium camelliae]|uniref:DUF3347 domain-containing protein n=1 Tax=Chryseobacterium camelliae TaxID=1265445 RepID=UPI0028620C47|nr:DUF3347 domain-containing protein [Chryseobacterium camelliae]MDR6515427.1 hypothetical protein [Chryseobacterium camelliae]